MPQPAFDKLRALAIGTQALGLVLIMTLETVLGDAARPWQGGVLAVMISTALTIALLRVYRKNRTRKQQAQRMVDHDDA